MHPGLFENRPECRPVFPLAPRLTPDADRQHGVRLAATERRLQLDDRIAALAASRCTTESSSRRMPSVM